MTTDAIAIPRPFSGPHYHDNARSCGRDSMPCAICGKPILDSAATWEVHVVDGGAAFAPMHGDEPIDAAGDMFWFPVGERCARAIPLTHRQKIEG